jgi:glyoxylase-like metal-dependent hydrolase (beta-lactamase superfamily II)
LTNATAAAPAPAPAQPGTTIRYPWDTPPASGEAIEVAPDILWMRLPLPMKLDHVNVYALSDGDGWTIIDTGFASRHSRAIWQDLLKGPLKGRPVTRIIATHHHPDHIGLAGWFQSDHGAELVTTRTAWLMARMLQMDEQNRPTNETQEFWRSAGMDADILATRMGERPFNFADVVDPMPLGFTRIEQGSTLTAGGRDWVVRIGNGHAPEHATLWSTDGEVVIGGDQLLPSISPNLGVHATEPLADPVADWLAACETLAPHATDAQLVLPGHKLPFFGLPLRLEQLITNHHSALDRLRGHLDRPQAAGECFQPLFKRSIGAGEYGLALVEAMAHCLHLYHLGEATRTRRDDGAWLWHID